jgi:hypothetical protein
MEIKNNSTERMRIVQCISSEVIGKNEECLMCRDNDRCLTVKPKLALMVEKAGDLLSLENMAIIKNKYPQIAEFDNQDYGSMMSMKNRIRVAMCLTAETPETDENCNECRLNGCCMKVNPELASMVENCKTSNGYEFTPEDFAAIGAKYPQAVEFDDDGSNPGITAMRDFIIESYYNSEIMPIIVSKEVISRLEDGGYTDDEIELLYAGITGKYDKMLSIYEF